MAKRSVTKSFAKGVRWNDGAWRYRVPAWVDEKTRNRIFDGKKEYKLGATQYDAAQEYARCMRKLEGGISAIITMDDLISRYTAEVVPLKAPATQKNNLISLPRLKAVFGELEPGEFQSPYVYQYRDKYRKHPTSANHDLEVLSHLFSKAIEWGVISNDQHPMRGLRYKFEKKARDRYVEDWELAQALEVASPFLKAYVALKTALGLRKGDMLRLKLSDKKADGIYALNTKTGKKTIYDLTPEREAAWRECLAVRPKRRTHFELLFCTRDGKPYIAADGTTSGFDSVWQRFMRKALADTDLTERFTEHDLRAKVGSDSDSDEEARTRLGHASTATTRKIYRRKGERAR